MSLWWPPTTTTRMPAANHSFYLRSCYLENKLTGGTMQIGGKALSLGKVTIPIYNLATREDHIAPARSVLLGSQFFGGPMRQPGQPGSRSGRLSSSASWG